MQNAVQIAHNMKPIVQKT